MSTQIETHYINTYKNTVSLLSQQTRSKLEGLVMTQPCVGNGAVVADQFGTVNARKKSERHEDTKYSDTPRARRWLQPQEYYSAELVDKSDLIRLLTDPKSTLAQAHVAAMNRAKDSEILTQIFASAATGELPTSGTTAYSTTNDIAADYELTGTPSGLAPAKIVGMHKKFMDAFVDTEAETPVVVIPPKGWQDMYGSTQFTSGDYNANKPLNEAPRSGIVSGGMALYALAHADFPVNGTTEWYCPAFLKSGVVLGIWQEIEVEVQKMPQKVSSWEVKVTARFGATRVEEAKVGRIKIKYA